MSWLRKVFFTEEAPAKAPEPEVEISTEAIDKLFASAGLKTEAPAAPPAPVKEPSLAPASNPVSPAEVYIQQGVPAVAYTAEQMATVLAGLSAIPAPQRRLAIDAMDAADDRWTLGSVIADAQAKRAALDTAITGVHNKIAAAEAASKVEAEDAAKMLAVAKADVEAQIAALRADLAEIEKMGQEEAASRAAALQTQREQAAKQETSFRAEQARLDTVLALKN